ncbi:MAG: glycosyltransferase family A protein [Desulfurivibrionaceae bacterium]|nr:glycosyltransferase family A protein [Desulfurivibrionaceae bacterium]
MSSLASRPTEPVSVIIPTYNRQILLGRAIDSVLRQTGVDFELLIVDDGSTDATDELVASHGSAVRYLYQENLGAAAARNTGIKAARYDLMAFLDSDDGFAPGKLAVQATAMATHPEYLVSHTDEVWYRRGRLLNQKNKHARKGGFIFPRCLELCAVGMSTAMVRRELFDEVGLFDETLVCCEDYDLWLRVSARFPFLLVAEPLTIKNGGRDDQLSRIHRLGMDRHRIAAILKIIESGGLNHHQEGLARRELVRRCGIYGRGCLKHGRAEEGGRYLQIAGRYGDADAAPENPLKKIP